MTLNALGLNCTLKSGTEKWSTQELIGQVLKAIAPHDVETASVRAADLDIKSGVKTDEGEGSAWPALRQPILDSNLLVLATPIWMGHHRAQVAGGCGPLWSIDRGVAV